MSSVICQWCHVRLDRQGGKVVAEENQDLCRRCALLALHGMELARQIAIEVPRGGVQLYLAIERTGQKTELLSVKRWSPFEPLESANSAEQHLHTFPSRQE
ncbi:MAG TPA: hypothetical protein VGE97_09835 [Nitrososphaera sp.]|jgi:hypothetical protein